MPATINLDLFRVCVPPCGRSSESHCLLEVNGDVATCIRCGCYVPSITARSS
jgi:hypothetical protein